MDESYQRRRQLHVASGITSLPTTSTTKCVQLNGEISVLSMSTTRFYLSNALQFRDTTHDIFEDKADKLLHDMWESIQSRIRYNESSVRPTLDTTMLMEVTVAKRSIDAIICQTEAIVLRHAAPAVECSYANINTFITKQQDPIPELMDARRNFSNNTETFGATSTAVIIEHIPNRINGIQAPVPIPEIRNATYDVSQFMAALGQNFYADYYEGRLFVLYDTRDLDIGFEISQSLLVCMVLAMVVCLSLWTLVEWQLDGFYTSSLYANISTQIADRNNNPAPMLMRSEVGPVALEGFELIPDKSLYEMDVSSSTTILRF